MATEYRYRIYTGPTIVNAIADRLSIDDRIRVTIRGTEHVYIETVLTQREIVNVLGKRNGWTYADVHIICAIPRQS